MTRLIDADGLKNTFWHGDLVPNKEMYHISEIKYAIDNAPTVKVGYLTNCANCERVEKIRAERPQGEWIPVSERLPEDLEPVNITWINHEPEPYYHDIKDKNFVATGIHYRGRWYWYSTTCADYLGEYGSNDIDKVDDAVEIVAWMPLPEPYKAESEDKE